MKMLRRIGQALVVLVIVGFCLLLGLLGSCMIAARIDPDPAMLGPAYDWATMIGAGVGLILGIAAALYYYRRR
jgi:hypothetical protein